MPAKALSPQQRSEIARVAAEARWALHVSPAMAAGIDNVLHDMEWVVGLIDAISPDPAKRGPYKKAASA